MEFSLWQEQQSGDIWVHCSGGIVDVDLRQGPGDRSLANNLGSG